MDIQTCCFNSAYKFTTSAFHGPRNQFASGKRQLWDNEITATLSYM